MSDTSQKTRGLTPEQLSELVMRRKKKREAEAVQTAAPGGEDRIVRRNAGVAPLSFAQQRLWLLDRLEPGNAAYNLGSATWLRGSLEPAVLAACLTEIAARHESMRTAFETRDEEPVQVIAPPADFPVPMVDLTGLPQSVRKTEATRLARVESTTPFDLSRSPLARAWLLRLDPREHLLLLDMHHVISDGWSFGVFFRELSALYEAFVQGKPSPLPELPIQYADFAAWQRQWLQGAALQEQISYWREKLEGATPSLELPTDRVRPPVQTHRGDVARLKVPADLSASLRELSRRLKGTLFMTLLAAFKVLLHRWAGQDDIVVGSPSAGRGKVETEGLIGFFLNTLVLRSDLAGNPTYLELLERVREVVLGAYRYQDLPFERLLEELKVERQLSRPPLFQVMFNMITLGELRLDLHGLTVEPMGLSEPLSKFDFTLYVEDNGTNIQGNLVYNADLFDHARMEALLAEYTHLLAQVAAAPDTRIEALSLVPAEMAALLPDPRQPLPAAEWPGPVHARLSVHAAHAPEREAVADGSESWTYGELEARSNQLAHRLGQAGVGRGDVVAIYGYRGASLVWAVMGAMKSGAAFLVLDPAYPGSRLEDYLDIARPKAWIAVRGAGQPAPETEALLGGVALRLELPPRSEADAAGLSDLPATPPDVAVGPDDPAVIGFTSGSTGRPKGVLGLHGALSQFQPWWQARFELSEADRFGMLSALSHDPLQRDILTPVWVGASLRIPDPERMFQPGWLAGWVSRERVSVLHLTPAMLELVVADGSVHLPTLRRAFVVGDLLRRSEVARLQAIAPEVECVNLYGSTETQRSVSYSPVSRQGGGKEALPLGRGIEGVDLLVLNAAGGLAAIGEVGEVYMRSRRMAGGYLGDEELTAKRFLTNPFRPEDAGDRLYRTGDLGRYRPDGEVEFAGRADQQVKIRGFRIEPGDIEAAMRRLPDVRECVVVARGDGEKRLVAYLAPASAAQPARELRTVLGKTLPDYMVPAAFVWLDALPLTKTGKLDRRALPEPEAEAGEASAAPRTAVEELVAGIWMELLPGREHIGVHDNFFDLGGHSLLATRVLARIREALGVDVPLRALFESPTLEGLAAAAERLRGDGRPPAPPIVPVPRGEDVALPLSFTQQRLWILDQIEPGSFAYNLAAALRLQGELSIAALRDAIAEIVRRHESLRTVFAEDGEGEPRQVVLPAGDRPLPVVDLEGLPAAGRTVELSRLAAEDAHLPFDLTAGPLLRTSLVRMSGGEHVLLLCMHHIVTDGWSLGIFTRELTELYRAFSAGAPSPLPELALQFADYAAWQSGWLRGEALDEQLRYWAGHLRGAPPVLEMPADRPRPTEQSHRGGRLWLTLGRELNQRIAAESRKLGVTPFMTLFAAFAALLRRYSGEEDLVIGTPIANRGRRELEEIIGFFANTLALRVNAAGDPAFADLARRVREAALGAFAHQDLPFERLVDELQPERNLAHSPIFQVLFILQNAPPAELALGDLKLGMLDVDSGRAQFDLNLALMEIQGELIAKLEYSSDLFDAATGERLLAHFGRLVEGVAAAPRTRLSALPLLSAEERHELLVAFNDTRAEIPLESTVHELFLASARRTPEAVAVTCDGQHLLYRDVEARAARLARHLVALGVGPDVRVGICHQRTPEMVVAMLGVLMAGGAYVPLDPSHPAERLGWILEDAAAPVLIADPESLGSLPPTDAVVVNPAALNPDGDADVHVGRRAGPEDLAYVIYTSGSTGRPKGVEVRHRGVVNYLLSMARRPGLTGRDAVLALTTLSFDIAVTELLLPLAVGARIELVDRETAADAERLAAVIEHSGVTVVQATPATWTLLLEGGWAGKPDLRVLAGGEALPPVLAGRLLERVGELWNVYGPTETTVWSTMHQVTSGERRVPIGKPLANTTIHLLDQSWEPAPVGVGGELCIGGEGLARGYLGRPDLTAERFVPDPFGTHGARLYRTGDLARRLPGGDLEYLGRIDHQVKVRGFRIELGEIEAALCRLPGIAQAAVVVREGGGGEKRLVAFLQTESGAAPQVSDLRAGLRERLPDYMVPAAFVAMDALPLNPSGKVDRRALGRLEIETGQAGDAHDYVPPRTETEHTLAAIWAGVLGRERVGVEDNFFSLGGDSILAIRVVTLAGKAGIRFKPRDLFQHQTVAALAAAATVETAGPQGPALPPFRADLLADAAWNDAVLITPPAGVGAAELEAALGELAARHEALRLRFAPEPALAEPAPVTLAVASPDRIEELRDGIDLAARPWTAALIRREGRPDRLLLAIHRAVLDGAAWEGVLEDLRAIAGRATGAAPVSATAPSGLATELTAEETAALLGEIGSNPPEEILAAALAQALSSWSGNRRVSLDVELRGTVVPLRLEVGGDAAATFRRVKDELRRPAPPAASGQPEVALRWRGRFDSADGWGVEALPSRPRGGQGRAFEVVGLISEGRLRLAWGYPEGAYRPEAARSLAEAAGTALRSLAGGAAPAAAAFTPSDFPTAGLNQEDLDDLLAELALD